MADSQDDKDAELAALQAAFDDHIASSKELEEELEKELQLAEEKLAESESTKHSLKSQLEDLRPQLMSIERTLATTRSNLEKESSLRRQAELRQDEAETKARVAEGTIASLREECDTIHEEVAFKEVELEELRIELDDEREGSRQKLEEEREHHRQELRDLQADLEVLKRAAEEEKSPVVENDSDADHWEEERKRLEQQLEDEREKHRQEMKELQDDLEVMKRANGINAQEVDNDNDMQMPVSDENTSDTADEQCNAPIDIVPPDETDGNQSDDQNQALVNAENIKMLEEQLSHAQSELTEYKQKLPKTEKTLEHTQSILKDDIEIRLREIIRTLTRYVENGEKSPPEKVSMGVEVIYENSTELTILPHKAAQDAQQALYSTTSRLTEQVIPSMEEGVKQLLLQYDKVRQEKKQLEMELPDHAHNCCLLPISTEHPDILSVNSDKTQDRSNRSHKNHKRDRKKKGTSPRSLRSMFHIPHWHRHRNGTTTN